MLNRWAERNKQRKGKRKEGRREEEELFKVLSSSSPLVRKHQVIKKVFGVFSLEKGLFKKRTAKP